jgi:hypothetical protein
LVEIGGFMSFLKKAINATKQYATTLGGDIVGAGNSLAKGDTKGYLKGVGVTLSDLYTGGQASKTKPVQSQTTGAIVQGKQDVGNYIAPTIPADAAQPATLTPTDPNVLLEQQMLEEQKRRQRLPGRSQFALNRSSYQTPSLIGDNSALSPNNRLV